MSNDAIVDYGTIQQIKNVVLEIADLDKAIELAESRKAHLRTVLEKLMGSAPSCEINGVAIIKKIPESIIYSYDTKAIQATVDALLRNGHSEFATMLANAKKESTRKASIRISKWKDAE